MIHSCLKLLSKGARGNTREELRLGNKWRWRPNLEQLDERLLPSLTPLSPSAGFPYSAVTEVQVTFPDRKVFVGSGAMVDSFHALTAAHMLYSSRDGGWATSIKVTPDMYYSSSPYGVAWGTYERVDPSWPSWSQGHPGQTSASVEDIGLVTLNSTIGFRTGCFGFGYSNNPSFYANAQFETAGYPASYGYNGQQMYYSIGRAIGEQGDDIAAYQGNITAVPGQSGSPLWSGNDIIYGVFSGYTGTSAFSESMFARITQAVFNELQSWRLSDRMPTSSVATAMSASVSEKAGTIPTWLDFLRGTSAPAGTLTSSAAASMSASAEGVASRGKNDVDASMEPVAKSRAGLVDAAFTGGDGLEFGVLDGGLNPFAI
jgi:V8-like Glu-specific endopeptidase